MWTTYVEILSTPYPSIHTSQYMSTSHQNSHQSLRRSTFTSNQNVIPNLGKLGSSAAFARPPSFVQRGREHECGMELVEREIVCFSFKQVEAAAAFGPTRRLLLLDYPSLIAAALNLEYASIMFSCAPILSIFPEPTRLQSFLRFARQLLP